MAPGNMLPLFLMDFTTRLNIGTNDLPVKCPDNAMYLYTFMTMGENECNPLTTTYFCNLIINSEQLLNEVMPIWVSIQSRYKQNK